MSKTTSKFSPEVRERAVRLVLDNEAQHSSRWQAVMSIAAKIGCTPQTLNDLVKKVEVDSGRRAGVPTLARIPDYKITKVDDLMPWKWRA